MVHKALQLKRFSVNATESKSKTPKGTCSQRILEAAQELFVDQLAEFTLDKVAALSEISVQTVIRAFGKKETLIIGGDRAFRESDFWKLLRRHFGVDRKTSELTIDSSEVLPSTA